MVATSAEISWLSFTRRLDVRDPAVWSLAAISIAFVGLFWPSWVWMAGEWSASGGMMSHGYLVAAISVYLLVISLPSFAAAPMQPSWWMLPIVLGLSVVWLFAFVANVAAAHSFMLPITLLATIGAAFGFRAARAVAFAVLYLYFAMPAWDQVQFIFQTITTAVVHLLIRLSDVTAFVESNFVHVSSGTFEIAGGCAGVRYILSALSLAALYGHLYYSSWFRKAALLFVAMLVAMIGNWIRVFVVIMIGDATDMQSPLVADHATLGWILFGVLMVPVYFLARKLEDPEGAGENLAGARVSTNRSGLTVSWIAVAMSASAMLVGPLWASSVAGTGDHNSEIKLQLPIPVTGWRGPIDSAWDWEPVFVGATEEQMGQYESVGATVLVYGNVYLSQTQDKELIYFQNKVAGDWRVSGDDVVAISGAKGPDAYFRQLRAEGLTGSWLIWYRYRINDHFVIDERKGKIAQAVAVLSGRPEAGITAYAAKCELSCDAAAKVLDKFVAASGETEIIYKTAGT